MKANEITIHEGHPAINVKYQRSLYDSSIAEDVATRAYDLTVEMWWNEATNTAHAHRYTGVFSEGRSGGWCAPYFQFAKGKLQLHGGLYPESTGQGPDKGYPTFVDVEDAKERRTFAKFERGILKLLADVPEMYKSAVESVLESNAFDAGKQLRQDE
jgi:hypothetical protein